MSTGYDERHYRTFVLRLWREQGGHLYSDVWRFSLEDARTRQRKGFGSLEELVDFLQEQISPPSNHSTNHPT